MRTLRKFKAASFALVDVMFRLTLAVIGLGLTTWLPLSALHARSSAPAQAANRPAAALLSLQDEKAVEQLKQQGLYGSLQEAVAATRYQIRWEDQPALRQAPASYHAPNPAQRMNAY